MYLITYHIHIYLLIYLKVIAHDIQTTLTMVQWNTHWRDIRIINIINYIVKINRLKATHAIYVINVSLVNKNKRFIARVNNMFLETSES